MVTLTCDTDRRDGVTLVAARLDGGSVPQRVRLANRLGGPVWPPRRHGVPEAGWDGESFETVVPADETVAVGYASPAPPVEEPLAVVDREVVDSDDVDEAGATLEDSVTPGAALRELGDPTPPRDAVPIPVDGPREKGCDPATGDVTDQAPTGPPVVGPGGGDAVQSLPGHRTPDERRGDSAPPEAIEHWLDRVAERVATAERLTDAQSLPDATVAVREAGGLDEVERLVETLERDGAALEAVRRRSERLADRCASTDVPLSTFDRLT